jgi:2-amino-4-hydroxy-6-hydroxymethyldihydropteridine diphosphokinase
MKRSPGWKSSSGNVDEVTRVFIGMGSNLGDRAGALRAALSGMARCEGIDLDAVSSVYETDPVDVGGGPFLNAVAVIRTTLPPLSLLAALNAIEDSLGRKRTGGEPTPRDIDLDILLYGNRTVHDGSLTIPHPRMTSRRFVMEPLAELVPELTIPGEDKPAHRINEDLRHRYPDRRIENMGRLLSVEP